MSLRQFTPVEKGPGAAPGEINLDAPPNGFEPGLQFGYRSIWGREPAESLKPFGFSEGRSFRPSIVAVF
jgi:hypothetical protein